MVTSVKLPKIYKLHVEPITTSKAKFLKFFGTKNFYANRPLEISFLFENISGEPFPGCTFSWRIAWPSGQAVEDGCNVPALQINEKWQSKPYPTDALSEGFGLISPTNLPRVANGSVVLDAGGREYRKQDDLEYSFGSIPVRRTQETYTYYGVMISAIALLIAALDKIIALLKWLLRIS
jgi:hypothetical protein